MARLRLSWRATARASGLLVAGVAAALFVWGARPGGSGLAALSGAMLLLAAGGLSAWRLWRAPARRRDWRFQAELLATTLALATVVLWHAPGGLDGPFGLLITLPVLVAAAFARVPAQVAGVAFALLLGLALRGFAEGERGLLGLIGPVAALAGVGAAAGWLFATRRRQRKATLERRLGEERARLRAVARAYRLEGVPGSGAEPLPGESEEPLLRAAVDELRATEDVALGLLREALGLKTAALLLLDETGAELSLRAVASAGEAVFAGPFSAREGIAGAVLAQSDAVCLAGQRCGRLLPYAPASAGPAALCAVPLLEDGEARGLLLADRAVARPFGPEEKRLVERAADLVLRAVQSERVFLQIERTRTDQAKLYRAARELAEARTEAEVVETCVHAARRFAAFDFAAVTLFDAETAEHEIGAVSGAGSAALVGRRFRHDTGLVGMALAGRRSLPYRGAFDARKQTLFAPELAVPTLRSVLVMPLVARDQPLGALVLGSDQPGAFSKAVRPLLEVLAQQVALSLAGARMTRRLEELATTDGLTGLYNKRTLLQLAEQKVKSAQRFQKPLSVIVCDIDHFKRVNDTHGHEAGDAVLRGFAETLRATKRQTDVVARYGGEEFVFVCEETDGPGALLLVERARRELAGTTFHVASATLRVTCSFGIATLADAGPDWERLFRAADEALYASKRAGRDRATLWAPGLGAPRRAAATPQASAGEAGA